MAPAKKFGLTQAYLVLYNAACMAGWAYVLALGARAALAGAGAPSLASLARVWRAVEAPLAAVQWAMCAEVAHAALGLVPSPVATTALQVASRVVVLVAAGASRGASGAWPAGLAVLAWALVEVPRYAFYVAALVLPAVPFPLFWLRYSLFMVLYPAGITGEWFTLQAAAPALPRAARLPGGLTFDVRAAIEVLLYVYFAAGPFMILNMWMNRTAAFKKRFAKPPPPEVGVVFPRDGKGGRTTTRASQAAIAAAIRGCGGADAEKAATRAEKDKGWKFNVRSARAPRAAQAGLGGHPRARRTGSRWFTRAH
jgi:very-long-chain (3R)-3-hydroxyacyl-CoA dehydratase